MKTVSILLQMLLFSIASQAQTTPIEIRVSSATVPPGGMLQFRLAPTTPKPIIRGRQAMSAGSVSAPMLGTLQGGSLFSPGGDASGFALFKGSTAKVSFNSTNALLGTSQDTPTLVLLFPVSATSKPGQTAPLALSSAISSWIDPATGQSYAVTLTPGRLTVGGTLSVATVNPGTNVNAGQKVVITGMGFQPGLQVKLSIEAKVLSVAVPSSTEIDMTIDRTTNLTGAGITITNPNNEAVTYFSFQRTRQASPSTHPLLQAALPMFSTVSYSAAYFHPTQGGSQFSGIALQNTAAASATIQLQLTAPGGLLATTLVTLAPNRYVVRDISELFSGITVPASGSTLEATTPAPLVQMLGLIGDDAANTVTPVDPLLVP